MHEINEAKRKQEGVRNALCLITSFENVKTAPLTGYW